MELCKFDFRHFENIPNKQELSLHLYCNSCAFVFNHTLRFVQQSLVPSQEELFHRIT